MGLENLSNGEKDQLFRLMEKVKGNTNPGRQPEEEEEEEIGEGEQRKFGEAPKPNPPAVTTLISPEDWVEKQISTLEAVGEAHYLKGITRPKDDPIKAGIAAQPRYEAKMKDPKVLARRKTQLEKTNMEEWATMAEKIGAPALVPGVVGRRYKVERFVGKFQPLLKTHVETIRKMDKVTDLDMEKRVLENLRGLKKLKGKA